jgi:hypothetical protein
MTQNQTHAQIVLSICLQGGLPASVNDFIVLVSEVQFELLGICYLIHQPQHLNHGKYTFQLHGLIHTSTCAVKTRSGSVK